MKELGELEAHHGDFDQRNTKVLAISMDGPEDAKATQKKFPHLTVLADPDRSLGDAFQVIHPHYAPDGGDTFAPTTILIDGDGRVRWIFRADRFIARLSPAEVLTGLDEHVLKK
jgi:peroxiredoxin